VARKRRKNPAPEEEEEAFVRSRKSVFAGKSEKMKASAVKSVD